ncbi:GTPase-activating protein S13 [Malassezia cuniculi]|uniref:GTPase-activating protein S13 n=1 Tax=Malassezia cuniculi TaxID=948313 RepID=A0AAF0ETW0_9BASI|nr:GTPase-activating protein S13 [Malassezia cuniculi]
MAMQANVTADTKTVDTYHEDVVHDAQLDFYGKKLATCSSDRTIKVFDVQGGAAVRPGETLQGHEGPVWQVAWGHPSFGTILASASYDGKVFIWKHENGAYGQSWVRIKEHALHTASVNSIAWAPHELGATLACASSDGKVSVLTFNSDGSWSVDIVTAHPVGCNAVSWAPAVPAGAADGAPQPPVRRFASAGSDATIKIWRFSEEHNRYVEDAQLNGHTDWVRDVAIAPNAGLGRTYLASASQDRTVLIWTQTSPDAPWTKTALQPGAGSQGNADPTRFPDTVWRVSWSVSGNVLAVSCGDGKVSLWKENLKGQWECINEMDA